ncbi:MAG: sel1 repeat family protein [Bacteroidales bacterium]|nr:sel1 repeat family protein [Bacteroidales bacterium]
MLNHQLLKIVLTIWLMICCIGISAQTQDVTSMAALEESAKAGDVTAMYRLASYYYSYEDYKQAAMLFKKAGEKGLSSAKYMYGTMLLEGKGVKRNTGGALKWIEQAAKDGDSYAMLKMSEFYKDGLEGYHEVFVQKDPKLSKEWLDEAAKAGNLYAIKLKLRDCHNKSEKLPLWEKAAAAGDKEYLEELGKYYGDVNASYYNYEKARDYLTRAGDESALEVLNNKEKARLAKEAETEKQRLAKEKRDKELAALRSKAETGDVPAIMALADSLYKDKEYELAIALYKVAADKGNAKAMISLADCYYYGYGVPRDYDKAFKLFSQAKANGLANDAYVLFSLGYMYAYGQGTSIDLAKGRKYLNAAAAKGQSSARDTLNKLKEDEAQLRARQERAELRTRKPTNISVLGRTYVGSYNMDGMNIRQGCRFERNGSAVVTTEAYGHRRTDRTTWSQDGTKVYVKGQVLWLDKKGNLHMDSNLEVIFYRR